MLRSSHNTDFRTAIARWSLAAPPIFFLPLAFGLGIWTIRYVEVPFVSATLCAFFLLMVLAFQIRRASFVPLSIAAFFAIGILFGLNSRTVSDHHIGLMGPHGFVTLEGVVRTVPETTVTGKKETVSFVLDGESFYREGAVYQTKGKVQVFLHNPAREIQFGDRLRVRGTLEDPKPARNPHAFDYANYLAQHRIFKVFRGIGQFSVVRQEPGQANTVLVQVNRLRVHLKNRIESLLSRAHHPLASALLLGFRNDISRSVTDHFIRSGTAHLLAISGLNVSLIAGLFYVCAKFLRLPRALTLLLTVIVILLYTLLAGAKSPVLRAGIMGIVILVGLLFGQERNLKSAFFFAFFMLLLWDPAVLFQASFQLSFAALAALIFLLPRLSERLRPNELERDNDPSGILSSHNITICPQNWRSRIFGFLLDHLKRMCRNLWQTALASLAVTIGLFPILVWYFHLFSVISLLANLIVVPVATLGIATTFVMLVLDCVCPPLAKFTAFIPDALYAFQLSLVEWFANVPLGYFYVPILPWYFFIVYYGFLVVWILPQEFVVGTVLLFVPRFGADAEARRIMFNHIWRNVRVGFLGGLAALAIIFLIRAPVSMGRLIFFDLGRTEAAFVSFSNRANCLVNAGRHFPSDQAYWVLRSFFMASGVHVLDNVIITRVDAAHAGGFRTLSNHILPQHLWLPETAGKTIASRKYLDVFRLKQDRVHVMHQGDRIQLGASSEIYVEILAMEGSKVLALGFEDRGARVLYILSAEEKTFNALSRLSGLSGDLLFLPHHREQISDAAITWIKRLAPRYIISNQRDQVPEFLATLPSELNSHILFLAENGAVEFRLTAEGWALETRSQVRDRRNVSWLPFLACLA